MLANTGTRHTSDRIYNAIPYRIKNLENIPAFKIGLKNHLLESGLYSVDEFMDPE